MVDNDYHHPISHIIQELTQGKPYVFVIMAFRQRWRLYKQIQSVVESEGLACIRADDIPAAGHDLLDKIHLLIERSELLVAEISELNANVFYELGYAAARQKPLLLLAQVGTEIPSDLKGRERIDYVYDDTPEAEDLLSEKLRRHLRTRLGSRIALLRDMLESDAPQPAYIVASPKYPGESSRRFLGQVYDRRTFGDNLGIVGLLSAFGSIRGEGMEAELVSSQWCAPDFENEDINLYLIGSKKVNHISGGMLELVQQGEEPGWYLGHLPVEKETGDYVVHLYRRAGGNYEKMTGATESRAQGIIHTRDHGIVVRGPHPYRPRRIVMIMAGAHSLGTGAACLAVTRTPLIREISSLLPAGTLANKGQSFWALVEGEASGDGMLNEAGVKILEAGIY